jgi:tetratricopeptide (TPR) repeat protein
MSGVCQANLSIACFFLAQRRRTSNKGQLFSEAMTRIQDTLDEDPDGNPRYYEHLGRLYNFQDKEGHALEAWKTGIALDPDNLTCCREEYYQLKVYKLTKKDYGCTMPDYATQ